MPDFLSWRILSKVLRGRGIRRMNSLGRPGIEVSVGFLQIFHRIEAALETWKEISQIIVRILANLFSDSSE